MPEGLRHCHWLTKQKIWSSRSNNSGRNSTERSLTRISGRSHSLLYVGNVTSAALNVNTELLNALSFLPPKTVRVQILVAPTFFFHLSLCNQATSISWYLYFQLDYFSIFFDKVFLSWLTEGQIQWFAGTDTAIFQLRYLNQFLRLAFQILKCFTNSIVATIWIFFRNFWTSFSIDYWRVKLTSFDIGYRFSDEIEQISITISLPIF